MQLSDEAVEAAARVNDAFDRATSIFASLQRNTRPECRITLSEMYCKATTEFVDACEDYERATAPPTIINIEPSPLFVRIVSQRGEGGRKV